MSLAILGRIFKSKVWGNEPYKMTGVPALRGFMLVLGWRKTNLHENRATLTDYPNTCSKHSR